MSSICNYELKIDIRIDIANRHCKYICIALNMKLFRSYVGELLRSL